MKTKLLFSFAILLFGTTIANAQIAEGKYLLGGSVNFSHINTINDANTKFENNSAGINIQLGKFISANSVIGGMAQYSYAKSNSNGSKANSFGIGMFYRKYKSLGDNFYLFGEGNVLYNYGKTESIASSNLKQVLNGVSISLLPGISYSLTPKMQGELQIPNLISASYTSWKNSNGTQTSPTQNQFSIGANLNQNLLSNLGLGFKLIL